MSLSVLRTCRIARKVFHKRSNRIRKIRCVSRTNRCCPKRAEENGVRYQTLGAFWNRDQHEAKAGRTNPAKTLSRADFGDSRLLQPLYARLLGLWHLRVL